MEPPAGWRTVRDTVPHMRLVLPALLTLAACDAADVQTGCPDPFAVDLVEGEAALVRESSFLDFNCSPVVVGRATRSGAVVSVETALDTLTLSFTEDGTLDGVGYGRGATGWFVRGPRSASLGPGPGRGRFEVVVSNGSLFLVRNTLRGQFYAAPPAER